MLRVRYAAVALVVLLLTACTSQPASEGVGSSAATETTPGTSKPVPSTPAPAPTPTPAESASESFLAWVEVSRVPDVDASCRALAPELVTRMIAEMQSEGFAEVRTCEEMITVAADLYRSFDQNADITIAVESETETDAVLHVTYLASGDCGTVVMERVGTEWVITDQSQEECQ